MLLIGRYIKEVVGEFLEVGQCLYLMVFYHC
jgi:hypothetical protein